MPKVLIREYDKSTTGIPGANNFAVVVPGFFGTPAKDDEGNDYEATKDLWNAYDVYELTSQADFVNYIGLREGEALGAAGPQLTVPLYEERDADAYSTFVNKITIQQFEDALKSNGAENVYRVTTVATDDSLYGTDSKLVKTIKYYRKSLQEKQAIVDGEPQVDGDGQPIPEVDSNGNIVYEVITDTTETKTTIKLTKVTSAAELSWLGTAGKPSKSNEDVCIIKAGQEGSNAITTKQIGNQIAYELLGLGYTVLYKKLDDQKDALDQLSDATFWEPLKDKSVFNFRYVMAGGCYQASVMNQLCALANFNSKVILEEAETYGHLSGRGDCIALCDIDEDIEGNEVTSNLSTRKVIENLGYAINSIQANEYSAIFGPKVTYIMPDKQVEPFGNNREFPASFHYLACAARTFGRYNEWYAVAGYNRGISNYSIEKTSVKLGEIAINTLSPRIANTYTTKSANLILFERGNYYLWGNRTGYALDNKGIVFHHFLNIRQLCCSIKKQLYTACRQFTFDPNSDLLWINFVNAIKPTLENMKADQGVKGYTITRVANNKKALLTARIRIVPIEAVEDFDISIYLEDSLTGIVVSADETQA